MGRSLVGSPHFHSSAALTDPEVPQVVGFEAVPLLEAAEPEEPESLLFDFEGSTLFVLPFSEEDSEGVEPVLAPAEDPLRESVL